VKNLLLLTEDALRTQGLGKMPAEPETDNTVRRHHRGQSRLLPLLPESWEPSCMQSAIDSGVPGLFGKSRSCFVIKSLQAHSKRILQPSPEWSMIVVIDAPV